MSLWRKPVVVVGGGILVLAGVVMLVTPGPGLVAILAGVAVWASEYVWAERLLRRIRERLAKRKVD